MRKVITYGTYDLLHQGHINLLKRAKELGDYLIVGVTSSDFDVNRGKDNVQQPLLERIEAVRATGLADLIIPEEYVGQKIDDIVNYDVDVFTVGSDWVGYFDYLKEYCEVVYLDRTEGVSSTMLRSKENKVNLGVVGADKYVTKFIEESKHINGAEVGTVLDLDSLQEPQEKEDALANLIEASDALYVACDTKNRFDVCRKALSAGKHVLCEAPVALCADEAQQLQELAKENGLIFLEAVKTAYSLGFSRLVLLVKSGRIGDVVSVRATCTSLASKNDGGSLIGWGPIATLPIYSILGNQCDDVRVTLKIDEETGVDSYAKVDYWFDSACASFEVASGVKSEGELIIAGTKGYVYVPSPWWKTDYFEVRGENPNDNRRFFYQLVGEGIRSEISIFLRAIADGRASNRALSPSHSVAFSKMLEDVRNGVVPIRTIR